MRDKSFDSFINRFHCNRELKTYLNVMAAAIIFFIHYSIVNGK